MPLFIAIPGKIVEKASTMSLSVKARLNGGVQSTVYSSSQWHALGFQSS